MPQIESVQNNGRIHVWDVPLRLFHWLLVIAMAVAFLSAEEDSMLNSWHMMSGWIAAILIIFRITWGFVGGGYARFSGIFKDGGLLHHFGELLRFKPSPSVGHNPLGWIAALTLIAVSTATIWTGVLIVNGAGEFAEELHEVIGWGLLALVAIHVAAVVIMSFLTRDNLVRAMVSGSKSASRHKSVSQTKKPSLVGYIISLAVIIAAIVGILRIEPLAFVPRSTEVTENEDNGISHEGRGYEAEYENDDDDND
jgi:cytochrome b